MADILTFVGGGLDGPLRDLPQRPAPAKPALETEFSWRSS